MKINKGMVLAAVCGMLMSITPIYAAEKTNVHLNQQKVYLNAGDSYRLKLVGYKVKDKKKDKKNDKKKEKKNDKKKDKVKWKTSNKKVARVDQKGKIQAVKNGRCYIRAVVGKSSYQADVAVSGVGLNNSYDAFIGKKISVHLNGTMKKPKWSVADPKTAKIDGKGQITGVHKGSTTLKAAYKGKTYQAALNVYKAPKLNKKKLSLGDGESYTLKLNNGQNITDYAWKTSNQKIATVKNGVIRAKKKGDVIIQATDGDMVLKCKVKVFNKVRINQKDLIFVPKDQKTYTLRHQGKKKVKWSVGNKKLAKINNKGQLTAKNQAGKTYVYAKMDKKTYKSKLTVITPQIVSTGPYRVGNQYPVTLDQMIRKPIWSSSDPTIATVSKEGVLMPKKSGTVNIIATIDKYQTQLPIQVIGKYKLVFNKNGDAMGDDIPASTHYEDDQVTLPNGFNKPGYDQVQWNSQPDGSGTAYSMGGTYNELAQDGTLTLYAIYQKKAEYANIPAERALAIVGLTGKGDSGTGEFKEANNRMTSIDYIVPSQNMYFSIDDFVHYQIDYAQYDMNGKYLTKNGWRSHGLIMKAGYKYRMSFRKPDDSAFNENDIAAVSGLIRYEVPDPGKLNIVASPSKTSHRGINSSKTLPENSMLAFDDAKKKDINYIETDIHSTADGNFAVIHDKTMGRTTAKKVTDANGNVRYVYDNTPVKDLTMDEIKNNYVLLRREPDSGRDADHNYYEPDENGYYDESEVYPDQTVPSLGEFLEECAKEEKDEHAKGAFVELKEVNSTADYQNLVNILSASPIDMNNKDQFILSSFNVGYLENIKNTVPDAQGIHIYPLLHDFFDEDELTLLDTFNYTKVNDSDDTDIS